MEYPVTIKTEEEAQQFAASLITEALEAAISGEKGMEAEWWPRIPPSVRCAAECARHLPNKIAFARCFVQCMRR